MNTQEHLVHSSSGEFSRKIWLLDAADKSATRLAVFLDGEYYVNHMAAPAMIHELQRNGSIPAVTCLFVSHADGAARHQNLTCNNKYSDYIVHDLVQWVQERNPELTHDDHLIAGTSLGGLASAFIALSYPQIFSRCLSHSGSFWWKDEWLTENLDALASSPAKFWLSVGDKERDFGISHPPSGLRQEVAQVSACERFASSLTDRNHSVHYRVYEGGHEIEPWKDELPDALRWLLN